MMSWLLVLEDIFSFPPFLVVFALRSLSLFSIWICFSKKFQVAQGPRVTWATDKSVCVHVDCILNKFLIRTLWARIAFYIDLIVRFTSCGPITAVSCFPSVMDIPPNTSIFDSVVWVAGFKLFAHLLIFRRRLLVFLDPVCYPDIAELYYQDFLCLFVEHCDIRPVILMWCGLDSALTSVGGHVHKILTWSFLTSSLGTMLECHGGILLTSS